MSISTVRRWLSWRHLVAGYVWALLLIPSLVWWQQSVLLVIIASLYANSEASFATHHARGKGRKTIDLGSLTVDEAVKLRDVLNSMTARGVLPAAA